MNTPTDGSVTPSIGQNHPANIIADKAAKKKKTKDTEEHDAYKKHLANNWKAAQISVAVAQTSVAVTAMGRLADAAMATSKAKSLHAKKKSLHMDAQRKLVLLKQVAQLEKLIKKKKKEYKELQYNSALSSSQGSTDTFNSEDEMLAIKNEIQNLIAQKNQINREIEIANGENTP